MLAMQCALLPARASAPGRHLWPPREGLPIHQAPFVSSPAPPCLLPWICTVHSRFPESECRFGWEEGRPGVPQPYCQPEGKSGPESERPREEIPSLERDQEHSATKAPSVGLLLQGSVSGAPTTHLCKASLPRGWSAPEATAALAHSSSV